MSANGPRRLALAGLLVTLVGAALFVTAGLAAGPGLGLDDLLLHGRAPGARGAFALVAAGTAAWVAAAIWYFRMRR